MLAYASSNLTMSRVGQQDALSYLLYVGGGCADAFHLGQVRAWARAYARLLGALNVAAAIAAEGVYFLAAYGVITALGSGSDPFQPSLIPFNIGAVTCGYLAGAALVRPGRSRRGPGGGGGRPGHPGRATPLPPPLPPPVAVARRGA